MGGSIVMERKGQESLGCPDVKHNHYVTPRQRILLPTGWFKMSVFPSTRLVLFLKTVHLEKSFCRRDDPTPVFMSLSWIKGGWGLGASKVVATFNHVGGSFNLFMVTTGDVWIIPSFRICYYVLHVVCADCWARFMCGQHQCVIPSPLSIDLRLCWRKTLPESYYPYL